MKVCARVKSLTTQRRQRRELNRQHADELLIADAIAGLNGLKSARVNNETEFRRRFR